MAKSDKILIIDDDEWLRLSLRGFLEGLGMTVTEAVDGPSGLAAVTRDLPDLVLLDITMPGLDGFAVCKGIRALPGFETVPVIVMTSLLGTEHKLEAFRSGAVDFVVKPLHFEDVEVRVKAHLGIRHQTVAIEESRDALAKAFEEAAAMNRNLLHLNRKLRASEEAKTRFLALMRNSVYNPLADIMGLADRIQDEALPPAKAREFAALVKGESFQLDCQMRNVFSAADLEAGAVRPFMARVDVASIARDVLDSFNPSARGKGVDLKLELGGEGTRFPTDGDKLHQILVNLVGNAVACSGASGLVFVRIGTPGDTLEVEVEDRGPGLSEEAKSTLFEPFRDSADPGAFHRGQGLGLPVVKALVEILDGTLRLESEPGRGSTFFVTLPRAPVLDQVEAEALDGNLIIFDEPQEF